MHEMADILLQAESDLLQAFQAGCNHNFTQNVMMICPVLSTNTNMSVKNKDSSTTYYSHKKAPCCSSMCLSFYLVNPFLCKKKLGNAVSAGHWVLTCFFKVCIDIALPKCATSPCLLSLTATSRSSSMYFLSSSQKTSNFVLDSLCLTSRKLTIVLRLQAPLWVSLIHIHWQQT